MLHSPEHHREISFDNVLIEQLVSNEQNLFTQQQELGLEFNDLQKVDQIKFIIDNQLSELERLCFILFMIYKKKQKSIGRILHITQEECCYFKKMAIKKIKRYLILNSIDYSKLEEFVKRFCTEKQTLYFCEYYRHPHSVYIMKKLGCNNTTTILSGVKRALRRLERQQYSSSKEIATEAKFYVSVFKQHVKGLHLYCASKKKVPQELG